jgi:hypothetical protein
MAERTDYVRACPSCGAHHDGDPYDIGDGPEFACPTCDWCWGALGQPLSALCSRCGRPLGAAHHHG